MCDHESKIMLLDDSIKFKLFDIDDILPYEIKLNSPFLEELYEIDIFNIPITNDWIKNNNSRVHDDGSFAPQHLSDFIQIQYCQQFIWNILLSKCFDRKGELIATIKFKIQHREAIFDANDFELSGGVEKLKTSLNKIEKIKKHNQQIQQIMQTKTKSSSSSSAITNKIPTLIQIVHVIINFEQGLYHSSTMMINHENKTIEEFDPLGYTTDNMNCSTALENWTKLYFPADYQFIKCRDYCPGGGPGDKYACWLLTSLWTLTRISSSSEFTALQLMNYLQTMKSQNLLQPLLMRCGAWIIEQLSVCNYLDNFAYISGNVTNKYAPDIQDKITNLFEFYHWDDMYQLISKIDNPREDEKTNKKINVIQTVKSIDDQSSVYEILHTLKDDGDNIKTKIKILDHNDNDDTNVKYDNYYEFDLDQLLSLIF